MLVRLIALPFWPRLWRESPEHGSGALILPLVVWALIAAVPGAFRVASLAREAVYTFASFSERTSDPLLLENGRFSLTGDRILHSQGRDATLLVDPEGTVPDSEITTPQYIAVRADRIVLQQPGQRREWAAADVAKLVGDRVLFDGDWFRTRADEWVRPGVLVGYPFAAAFVRVGLCGMYALAAGLLLLLLRGQWIGLDYSACVTVALAASAFTMPADLALTLFGVSLPVFGLFIWPLVVTALGFVALAGSRAPDA
jgi:Protein of unknown function (DUF1189)